MKKPGPRRSSALRVHIESLSLPPIRRYADVQRGRGKLLAVGPVDVDIEQMIERPFLCDRHRCIQWTPHERKQDARPLIDRSCCSRYDVPVTDLDQRRLMEILPRVRRRLAATHPLNRDAALPPIELDEEYSLKMREHAGGACQFVLYEEGRTTCAIHKTCIEEGLDPWIYKPAGCSLWPVALVDYEAEGGDEERLLLTVYGRATAALFESEEDEVNEDEHFACLKDQDADYEPMYRSVEGILTHLLGRDFYADLDRAARRLLADKVKASRATSAAPGGSTRRRGASSRPSSPPARS